MWIIFSTFPIEGRLLDYEKKVSQEHGVNLIVKWLGVGEAVAVKACKKEFGAYISYTILQELYEELHKWRCHIEGLVAGDVKFNNHNIIFPINDLLQKEKRQGL